MRYLPYQMVQDFFHQQYASTRVNWDSHVLTHQKKYQGKGFSQKHSGFTGVMKNYLQTMRYSKRNPLRLSYICIARSPANGQFDDPMV